MMPPKLPVGRGVEVVGRGADGQAGAEGLMAALVLVDEELGVAQRSLQLGKEVRDRLGVVPDVRAGAVAATDRVAAALPVPEPAVGLALDGGRLEDAQVGGDGLDDLVGERGVVECLGEGLGCACADRCNGCANRR